VAPSAPKVSQRRSGERKKSSESIAAIKSITNVVTIRKKFRPVRTDYLTSKQKSLRPKHASCYYWNQSVIETIGSHRALQAARNCPREDEQQQLEATSVTGHCTVRPVNGPGRKISDHSPSCWSFVSQAQITTRLPRDV